MGSIPIDTTIYNQPKLIKNVVLATNNVNYEKKIRHALRSAKQQTLKIMSINRNRAKLNKAHNNKEYKLIEWFSDPYWDEGVKWYPKGNRHSHSGKKIWSGKHYSYQIRMYKTWKHNRKTQWKV